MSFIVWHILAIVGVMLISFIAGLFFNEFYHSSKYIKQRNTNPNRGNEPWNFPLH